MTEQTTVKLQVAERFRLLEILPKQGDFSTLKIVRKLRENLSFSEEEHKQLGLSPVWECSSCHYQQRVGSQPECPKCKIKMGVTSMIGWDQRADDGKDVQFGAKATSIVVDALKEASSSKKLLDIDLPLYEKFIPDEGDDEEQQGD